MATIESADIIYATVCQRGNTIASVRLCGVSSFAEIIRQIREYVAGVTGLVTLSLRNSSKGWNDRRAVMLAPVAQRPVQLSLF